MRIRILIAVVVVMLALAAPAFASNPTDNAYAGTGATQIHNTGTTGTTEGTDSSASTLPFTGINVGVVGAIAVALMGTGFVLRRSTRARTD